MRKAGTRVRRNRVAVAFEGARAGAYVERLRGRAYRYLRRLGLSGCELSVALVGDAEIRRLNRRWRKKDRATDVLSFPAGAAPLAVGLPRQLGDVVISLQTAARVARALKRPVDDELACYLAHGLLHLLGYDHHKRADKARMGAQERRLLGRAGLVEGPGAPLL